MKVLGLLLSLVLLLFSCKKDDETTPPPNGGGYQYVREDSTVVTIPQAAVQFAQQNFSRDAQQMREFQVATTVSDPAWQLGLGIWKSESWQIRQQYLVSPYEYDVKTDDSAQFYYEIGELVSQFGYGWKDTFDAVNFNPDSTYTTHIWPSDHPETVGFDGQSAYRDEYVGMWVE